jgi:hypothetical protein
MNPGSTMIQQSLFDANGVAHSSPAATPWVKCPPSPIKLPAFYEFAAADSIHCSFL